MAKTLVIVESPAKARTIERILKEGYEVRASYGHVRDLPESADEIPEEIKKKKWGRLGVDTDGNFTPYYVVPNDKRKYVQALKAALKGASQVYLATDPDREEQRLAFRPATYWDLEARLSGEGREFTAQLARFGDERVASGKDFDDTGALTGKNALVLTEADSTALVDALWKNIPWTVTAV